MKVHLLATSVASRFCITHPNSSVTTIYSDTNESVVLEHLSSKDQRTFRCEMTPEEALESAKAFALQAAYAEIGFSPDQENQSQVINAGVGELHREFEWQSRLRHEPLDGARSDVFYRLLSLKFPLAAMQLQNFSNTHYLDRPRQSSPIEPTRSHHHAASVHSVRIAALSASA